MSFKNVCQISMLKILYGHQKGPWLQCRICHWISLNMNKKIISNRCFKNKIICKKKSDQLAMYLFSDKLRKFWVGWLDWVKLADDWMRWVDLQSRLEHLKLLSFSLVCQSRLEEVPCGSHLVDGDDAWMCHQSPRNLNTKSWFILSRRLRCAPNVNLSHPTGLLVCFRKMCKRFLSPMKSYLLGLLLTLDNISFSTI